MSEKQEEQQAGWVDSFFPIRFLKESLAIAEVELKKLIRDPIELFTRAVQPVLWIVIFGEVFSRVHGIPTGKISYLAFITPGILAQSVLFSAIFYGIAVIWERDLGIIHKLLVSPALRGSLVFGKAISSGFRGFVQVVIIYFLAIVMGIDLRWQPYALIGVLFSVVVGSAVFSTFSLIVACIVKTRERFMGIGQLLTMPLFFASNAIYPLTLMPVWLQWFAMLNPLTYLVDSLRGLMIAGGHSVHGLGVDFGVMLFVFIIFLLIADRLYPTLVQ
ncbi:MAG: ABC transporter permease [Deltaproteobacteria bacterium]|nr:ABC transporter permease [Deltaproteobacteria bacterium]